MEEGFRLPKTLLHEINIKRREEADVIADIPHQGAKLSGMDKVMRILGYAWKDNRYQVIQGEDS